MKDFDKIKEKKKSDDLRSIIILSIVFLVAFAIIVFAIIKLTNDYFDLKMKLKEAKQENNVQLTDPNDGKSYQFTAKDNESVVKNSEDELKELSKMDILEDNGTAEETSAQQTQKKKVPAQQKEVEKAEKSASAKKTEQVKESKTENTPEREKGDYVVQILSVQSKTDADREAEKLKDIVSGVYVMKADLGSKGVWYRVRCGKNTSKSYANNVVNKIKSETNYKPIVLKSD